MLTVESGSSRGISSRAGGTANITELPTFFNMFVYRMIFQEVIVFANFVIHAGVLSLTENPRIVR